MHFEWMKSVHEPCRMISKSKCCDFVKGCEVWSARSTEPLLFWDRTDDVSVVIHNFVKLFSYQFSSKCEWSQIVPVQFSTKTAWYRQGFLVMFQREFFVVHITITRFIHQWEGRLNLTFKLVTNEASSCCVFSKFVHPFLQSLPNSSLLSSPTSFI